jgi:hypothetical protein
MFAEPECPLKGFKKTYMTVFDQKIRIKVAQGVRGKYAYVNAGCFHRWGVHYSRYCI